MVRLISILFSSILVSGDAASENPIRKVVRLMQDMSGEIAAEKKKEQELYEKTMCICTEYPSELQANIETAGKSIEELTSKIEEETALKAKLAEELKGHASDKDAAEKDLQKATTLREKESAEFDESVADLKGSIGQLSSAIPALEKGAGASALMQAEGSNHLKSIVAASGVITDFDKKQVLAFLTSSSSTEGQDYAPSSGQVLGILKQMKDDMAKNLEDTENAETVAAQGYTDLKGAKDSEIEIASEAVESKTKQSGSLSVSIAQNTDALEDTKAELADAQKMLNTLTTTCGQRKADWEARLKSRDDEIAAISETITILNDDDALDVFKKAVPALVQDPSTGFLQTKHAATTALHLQKALDIVRKANDAHHDRRLMLLIMKMSAKQAPDFSAVSKMIDDMLAVLDNEQVEDVNKKEWCFTEISKADKEAGSKQETVDQLKAEIEQVSDEIGGLDDDLKALGESITGLDKEVAMSTEQRKKEHEEYTASLQMTEAAIALIGKAKNRLAKFYNPTVYKAPPKKEATMEEKIIQSYGFVQRHSIMHTVSLKKQMPDLPDMPTYEKKNSGGVVALLDKISLDLEKDSVEAGHDEKTAQQDYVAFMAESQASRAQDQKTMVDKQGSKAELEKKLVEAKSTMATSMEELQNSHELLSEIHNQCDFMVENFEMRKTARTAEIESLKNAKATLAGASF